MYAVEQERNELDELFGRLAAIDFVVKRLLTRHAEIFPDGVVNRMLNNEEAVLRSLDCADIGKGQRAAMQEHLAMMFRNSRALGKARRQRTRTERAPSTSHQLLS